MSAPLVPSPLDYVGRRKFVLYPPIANAGPNEWLRGRSSWSETQLVNVVTGQELWVAWQYICGVSDRAGLELVVELKEDLENREGNVSPRVKRIIPMPTTSEIGTGPRAGRRRIRRGPALVVGIKIHDPGSQTTFATSKVVLVLAALFVLAALVFRSLKL